MTITTPESLDDETPLAIVILPPAIPGQLVVADDGFMAALADSEAKLASAKITTADEAAKIAALQGFLTKSGTQLQKLRLEILRPFIDKQNEINAAARGVESRIELAKNTAKAKLSAWNQAQADLAAAAEKKRLADEADKERVRLAEIDRLQKIADEEARVAKEKSDRIAAELAEQERRRVEAEEAAKTPAPTEDLDLDAEPPFVPSLPIPGPQPLRSDYDEIFPPEKTEAQKQLEALKFAPVVKAAPIVAPKIQGVSFRSWVEIVSVDVNQLPEVFVVKTADTKAIRQTYISGWREGQPVPVCPGVVFTIKKEPITR